MLAFLYRKAVIAFAKPYIKRELPGWGILYRNLIGSFEKDWLWRDERERWVKGKLHGFQMSVRIEGWSNRHTFFLERFYDLPTQLLLQDVLCAGDTFVDVGANEGMITLLASRLVGPSGQVVAFEPNPVPRAILERNLQRNGIANVEVKAGGLGEEEGVLPLFIPHVNSGEGSFNAPDDDSNGDYRICPVFKGDDSLIEHTPRLIKIDVEGFEAQVLRGLASTLARAKPVIVIEMISGHLKRDAQTPQLLCALLKDLGYEGYRLGLDRYRQLTREPVPCNWEDGDYVFIPVDGTQ